jgi:hypothetical protein
MWEERDMQDDPNLASLISIGSYGQIKYWCAQFRCTEVQLAEAIAAVGYSYRSVREYLDHQSDKAA